MEVRNSPQSWVYFQSHSDTRLVPIAPAPPPWQLALARIEGAAAGPEPEGGAKGWGWPHCGGCGESTSATMPLKTLAPRTILGSRRLS